MAANARSATVFWIRSRNGQLEQVEGDVVAVERLGLTERLCPKEADEVVPSFREAESDADGRHERSEYLDRPNQPKSDGRWGAWKEGRRARRRDLSGSHEIDMACQHAKIAPRVDEHEARRRAEETKLAQEQTPEHLRVAEGLEPEELGKPVKRRQHDHEQEDDHPSSRAEVKNRNIARIASTRAWGRSAGRPRQMSRALSLHRPRICSAPPRRWSSILRPLRLIVSAHGASVVCSSSSPGWSRCRCLSHDEEMPLLRPPHRQRRSSCSSIAR